MKCVEVSFEEVPVLTISTDKEQYNIDEDIILHVELSEGVTCDKGLQLVEEKFPKDEVICNVTVGDNTIPASYFSRDFTSFLIYGSKHTIYVKCNRELEPDIHSNKVTIDVTPTWWWQYVKPVAIVMGVLLLLGFIANIFRMFIPIPIGERK